MSAFNGSGTYVISGTGLPFVSGTTISSTVANQLNTDLATGLSTCITKDGQTTTTAVIPFAAGISTTGISVSGGGTVAKLDSGTYTPTGAGITNIATVTPGKAQWLRVGNTVTVSGTAQVQASGAGQTNFTLTLPVTSNLSNFADCAGAGANNADNIVLVIIGETTSDKADCYYLATNSTSRTYSYTYTYEVK